jgi:hypothetical protein
VDIITGQSLTGNATWQSYRTRDGSNGVNMKYFVTGFTVASALGMT